MDPIRPIGPPERDLEPILRVTRSSPDGQRERSDQPEPQKEKRRPAAGEPPPPPDDESGSSLIDVRV